MKQADSVITISDGRCFLGFGAVVIIAGAEDGGSGSVMEGAGLGEGRCNVSRDERRSVGEAGLGEIEAGMEGSCGVNGARFVLKAVKQAPVRCMGKVEGCRWTYACGDTGETGSDLPNNADALVVTVSLRLRLIERIDWDSAKSRERKERPSST